MEGSTNLADLPGESPVASVTEGGQAVGTAIPVAVPAVLPESQQTVVGVTGSSAGVVPQQAELPIGAELPPVGRQPTFADPSMGGEWAAAAANEGSQAATAQQTAEVLQSGVPSETALTFTVTSSKLLAFVRLDDFIPCDYNADGVVDVLALSRRLSDGYGYSGLGNGLFAEGPSFDLPFRPAAAQPLGPATHNSMALASADGTLFVFCPLLAPSAAPDPKTKRVDLVQVGGQAEAHALVLYVDGDAEADVYRVVHTGLSVLGTYPVRLVEDPVEWLQRANIWDSLSSEVPILHASQRRTACMVDVTGDGIMDAVFCSESGRQLSIVSGSTGHTAYEALLGGLGLAVRTADVDANGLDDVMVLLDTGVLEVYLSLK